MYNEEDLVKGGNVIQIEELSPPTSSSPIPNSHRIKEKAAPPLWRVSSPPCCLFGWLGVHLHHHAQVEYCGKGQPSSTLLPVACQVPSQRRLSRTGEGAVMLRFQHWDCPKPCYGFYHTGVTAVLQVEALAVTHLMFRRVALGISVFKTDLSTPLVWFKNVKVGSETAQSACLTT